MGAFGFPEPIRFETLPEKNRVQKDRQRRQESKLAAGHVDDRSNPPRGSRKVIQAWFPGLARLRFNHPSRPDFSPYPLGGIMDKIDFKKTRRDLYRATSRVKQVEPGEGMFLAVDGQGTPGGPEFTNAIQHLYAVAYTLKFSLKKAGRIDFVAPPLETLWYDDPAQGTRGFQVALEAFDSCAGGRKGKTGPRCAERRLQQKGNRYLPGSAAEMGRRHQLTGPACWSLQRGRSGVRATSGRRRWQKV